MKDISKQNESAIGLKNVHKAPQYICDQMSICDKSDSDNVPYFVNLLRKTSINDQELAGRLYKTGCLLPYAAYLNNEIVIEIMLKLGSKVSDKIEGGVTSLHIACNLANLKMIKLLISHGACIADENAQLETPLSWFLRSNCETYEDIQEILKLLLKEKELLYKKDAFGLVPLFDAMVHGNKYILQTLFNMDVDLSILDESGQSFIFHLIANRNPNLFGLLDEVSNSKFDVNIQDEDGDTALHLACTDGNVQAVEYLIKQKADLYIKDEYDRTPLETAINEYESTSLENYEKIVYLLQKAAQK